MPSKSILEQKQAIVADLAEQLKNSPAGVVVNYQGKCKRKRKYVEISHPNSAALGKEYSVLRRTGIDDASNGCL